uniref:Uncharacterized protein n=2 Tax=Neisseria meningitidis TaxID=487 RepID=C6SLS1_NEIME|nr:hypothetical protein predicted by Glimmer/Critica [Neisseria meningitidis alpha153]CBA09264.1 hypothetical protein predicted by Glimmer/Critica [Neisseria meningitidis alpha275]
MPSENHRFQTAFRKISAYFDTLLSDPAIFVIIQTL